MPPLFRPEALQAQQTAWLGSVRVVRPPSLAWLTAGVLVVALAIGAFLWLAQYTRKATLAGVLTPEGGVLRLLAPQAGVVLERRAAEGQSVRAGDVLYVLAIERPTLQRGAQAQVERSLDDRRRALQDTLRLQQSLSDTRVGALDRRLMALSAEQAQLDAESALQQRRLGLARESVARLEALQKEQFISPAQVQTKTEELLALQTQAQSLERQRAALAREREELEGERRGLPLLARGAASDLQRELATLSRETVEQDATREIVMRAPHAGSVSAVLAEPGQSVTASAALATLVPQGTRLLAHLYAPSGAVGFVRPGHQVRLRYEAYPYQKYGQQTGQVLQVSRVPLAPTEMAALSLPAADRPGEPMFRITVQIDDAAGPEMPQPLMAGMRLQADVLLERRRLVEWLFEPLIALRQRL